MSRRELLRGFWYLVTPSKAVKPGQMLPKTLLGDPVLLGRKASGEWFAIRDHCPHRAMPLHHGRLLGDDVECCYHGWKFDVGDGHCSAIPALVEGYDKIQIDKIRIPTYPCRVIQGNVWVFVPEEHKPLPDPLPEPPTLPEIGDRSPQVGDAQIFPCHVDWAAIGLMDPAHAAFVHASWWWNSGGKEFREKEKHFEPVLHGYKLPRYELKKSARPYKLLGKKVSTEIIFTLPGIRMEIIRGEKNVAASMTVITPIDHENTEVHHCLYWTVKGLALIKPLAGRFVRQFLGQDRTAVVRQQPGIAYDETMMFVGDADQESRWYFALKKEVLSARSEGRDFENPIPPTTLRWRS